MLTGDGTVYATLEVIIVSFFGGVIFSKRPLNPSFERKERKGAAALRAAAPLSWASQKMMDPEAFLKKSPKTVIRYLVAWLLTK